MNDPENIMLNERNQSQNILEGPHGPKRQYVCTQMANPHWGSGERNSKAWLGDLVLGFGPDIY